MCFCCFSCIFRNYFVCVFLPLKFSFELVYVLILHYRFLFVNAFFDIFLFEIFLFFLLLQQSGFTLILRLCYNNVTTVLQCVFLIVFMSLYYPFLTPLSMVIFNKFRHFSTSFFSLITVIWFWLICCFFKYRINI